MAFAQLTYRESLRDIEACLHSVEGKLYRLGFRGKVARSTLADANESHDWRIFADFAQVLIRIVRPLYARTTKLVSISIKVCTLWIRRPSICVYRYSRERSSVSARPQSRRILCWTCMATFLRSSASPVVMCRM